MTKIQKDAELIVTRALVAELAQAQVKLNQPKPAQPQVKLNQPKCKLRSSAGRTPKAIGMQIMFALQSVVCICWFDGSEIG